MSSSQPKMDIPGWYPIFLALTGYVRGQEDAEEATDAILTELRRLGFRIVKARKRFEKPS